MIRLYFAAAISVFSVSAAEAASFDCQKASAPDEQAICANRALNDADVKMTTMFDIEVDLVAMGERDTLRSTQKSWLTGRAACKADLACLQAAYDQRLKDLQKVLADIVSRGPH